MRINKAGDTIHFKSHPQIFTPERDGLKCNTVRVIPIEELPEDITLFDIDLIEITNSKTGETFTRQVSHVAHFANYGPDETIWVFSWIHSEEVLE